jgi:hypothetical protein
MESAPCNPLSAEAVFFLCLLALFLASLRLEL